MGQEILQHSLRHLVNPEPWTMHAPKTFTAPLAAMDPAHPWTSLCALEPSLRPLNLRAHTGPS